MGSEWREDLIVKYDKTQVKQGRLDGASKGYLMARCGLLFLCGIYCPPTCSPTGGVCLTYPPLARPNNPSYLPMQGT